MEQLNTEWVIGNRLPMVNGYDFQVHLTNGTVRRVGRRPIVDYWSLFFKDCTHPAQNAYCSTDDIKAWKLAPQTLN